MNNERKYAREALELNYEYNYISSEVLVLNLKRLRELYSPSEFFRLLQKRFRVPGDIFNFVLRESICALDSSWSCPVGLSASEDFVLKQAAAQLVKECAKKEESYIYNFSLTSKPWNSLNIPFSNIF